MCYIIVNIVSDKGYNRNREGLVVTPTENVIIKNIVCTEYFEII